MSDALLYQPKCDITTDPPNSGSGVEPRVCKHEWQYLRSVYLRPLDGQTKRDVFYCIKCLEKKEREQ